HPAFRRRGPLLWQRAARQWSAREVSAMASMVTTIDVDQLQTKFLSVLPGVELHDRIHCHERCRQTRDDQIAEAIALAWSWYIRLATRGIGGADFPTALATYAVKSVGCGRRVAGMVKTNDVLNEHAQRRHGFGVQPVPNYSTLTPNPMTEALIDNIVTPPD